MNTTLKITLSVVGIFIILLACTNKEINLITNVELDFEQTHTNEGFVKALLPASFTITPEVFLPEFEYYFQYEVLEGEGTFFNNNDEALPEGELIVLERENEDDLNFSLDLNYQARSSGTHRIRVTASDNFEKSFSSILNYSIQDIPVVWELTSTVTSADEQQVIPINLTLQQITADPNITYQVRYTFNQGSGQLSDANGQIITLNKLLPINIGSQALTMVSNEIGTATLQAELIDSNNQTIPTILSFTILELDREPPIITVIGANPLTVFTGVTYTDPGASATDNRDDDATISDAIIIDDTAVDTSMAGTYMVTYTVTDSSDNSANASRTVIVEVNTTDIPQFTVKGNSADFTTNLELGTTYIIGTIDNLVDNGTITTEDIVDQSAIDTTTPDVGQYSVAYLATDNDMNTTTITETVVVVDTTNPSFTVKGNNTNFTTPLQVGTVFNVGTFQNITDFSATDGGMITDAQNIDETTPVAGQYTITYTVTDAEDNANIIIETVIAADTSAPVFSVKGNADNFTTLLEFGAPYILGTIDDIQDNGTTDDGIIEDSEAIGGTTPAIGNYTVTYSVTDDQDNSSVIIETVEVIDTTAPTFSIKGNSVDFTTEIAFGENYTPGTIDNPIDLSGFTETITGVNEVDINTEGDYQVIYTLTDQSPNENSYSITETIMIGPDNQPPTATIQAEPGLMGIAPYIVILDGSESSDPDAGDSITEYLWILGGGNQNTNSSVSQTYNTPGDYNITLRVTDQNGATGEEIVTVQVVANMPPTFSVKGNSTNFDTNLNAGDAYLLGVITNIQDDKIISDTGSITGATQLDQTTVCFDQNNSTVMYTVTDNDDAVTTITETINITDTQNPTINYTGATSVDIFRGQNYSPPSLTITDNDPCSNGNSATLSGTVDNTILGSNVLTYTGSDAGGNTADPVIITVNIVNQNPIANNNNISTQQVNTVKTYSIIIDDSDPDGDSFTIESVTQPPSGGTVTIIDSNTRIQFSSNNQTGPTSFTYRIIDEFGALSNFATVTTSITSPPVNNPPNAVNDGPITVNRGENILINVLSNDTDLDMDNLTITNITPQPSAGTAVIEGNQIRYSQTSFNPGIDVDSFSYSISDGNGGSDIATVSIDIICLLTCSGDEQFCELQCQCIPDQQECLL